MKFPPPLSLILATTLSVAAAEPTNKPDIPDDSQARLREEILQRAMIREFGDLNQKIKPHIPDDSQAHVLKSSGFFTLAQELGDTSVAGENEAARLMAAAKRIQTETRIASKSMRRVMILGEWRAALNHWEDLQLQLVLFWSGGGSMFIQMMSGNDFTTEELLDGIADHLPLAEKPLSKETSRKIDGLLKKAKERLAQGKAAAKKRGDESRMRSEKLAQQLEDAHAALKTQFQYAGDDAATQLLLDRCMEPTEFWEHK